MFEVFKRQSRADEIKSMYASLDGTSYADSTLSYHDLAVYFDNHHIPIKLRRLSNGKTRVRLPKWEKDEPV